MLERVWYENRRILVGVVKNLLPDFPWAEDILQEAFAKVVAARRPFRNEREAFNFIRKTVVNTSLEELRRSARRRRLGPVVAEWTRQSLQTGTVEDPLAQMIREEEREEKRSLINEIRDSLAALPVEQREAIEIVFKRRNAVLATCKRRGLAYSTVRSRMLVAVDRIRKDLRRRGVFMNHGKE